MSSLTPALGDPIPNAAFPTAGQGLVLDVSGKLPSSLINPARGTTFPLNPPDGYEFVYTADATNGIQWRFKYNQGSASSYKWEIVGGGPPLRAEIATSETRANVAYGALATAGPSIILPFAGDYDITIGFHGNAPASDLCRMSFDIGGTAAVDADSVELTSTPAINGGLYNYTAVTRPNIRKTGLAAVTLTAKYLTNGGLGTFKLRVMTVSPIRVSG